MKKEEKYGLSLINLKNKEYQYSFLIEDDFLELFEASLIEQGSIKVSVLMNKSETMLQFAFHFEGFVKLICDRSLDVFEYPLNFKEKMIFKFGEEEEVISEELEIISRNRTFIDFSQYFYEFINLAIPMKRLHPRYSNEEDLEDDDENNVTMVYQSDASEDSEEQFNDPNQTDTPTSDPRWEALRKLKNSQN